MNNSFKFIVNPKNTKQIEITSFLQYCALKNILSKFAPKYIESLDCNFNHILFSDTNKNFKPSTSFTKYIQISPEARQEVFRLKHGSEGDLQFVHHPHRNC